MDIDVYAAVILIIVLFTWPILLAFYFRLRHKNTKVTAMLFDVAAGYCVFAVGYAVDKFVFFLIEYTDTYEESTGDSFLAGMINLYATYNFAIITPTCVLISFIYLNKRKKIKQG